MTLDCFKIYVGFCFYSGMVRSVDQKMIDIEKVVFSFTVCRRGMLHYAGPRGKALGSVKKQE